MGPSKHDHDHTHVDHAHDDHHHAHNHAVVGDLRVALGINVLFTGIELVGGLLTNSVAIIADAVHDFGDSVTLAIALVMERVAGKQRTAQLTFGYRRFSTLGALVTGLVLIVGAVTVLIHTIPRLLEPQSVDTGGMAILAVIGVVMNTLAAIRLSRSGSMNARAAFLHLMEDVFGWIAVLLGAIAIRVWGILWLDPLLSVGINAYIVFRAVPILRQALRVMLQYVPGERSVDEVSALISAITGVREVHDVHLWTLDGMYTLLSAHVVADGERSLGELEVLKQNARTVLHEHGIQHVTLELESSAVGCSECDL
ncbi:MAG TPA: cation diffusion facilitator family transporter [Alkalispirochaeta sp.]|nr:cation diffusion facilitator family transporter [Alkalispirochaeta sp.]